MDWPTRATLNQTYTTTEIDVQYTTNPTYSNAWETDVIYGLGDLPGDVLGVTACDDPGGDGQYGSPNDECDQFYVTYDIPRIGDFLGHFNINLGYSFTWNHDQSNGGWHVSCHETGHTVGLLHPESSYPKRDGWQADYRCMRTDYMNPNSWLEHYIGGHNAAAINDWYVVW